MKLQNFKYFIKEGIHSFFKNGVMSLASVIIVMACLVLFGTYLVLSMNINGMSEQLQSSFQVRVNIENETSESRCNEIGEEIKKLNNVQDITFVSRDEAFSEGEEYFKNDPKLIQGYKDNKQNPFRAYYRITMVDLKQTPALLEQLKSINGIEKIISRTDIYTQVISTTNAIKYASLGIMLFLALISVLIISNTIKMAVFARRKDINIMKFVGATDNFVRSPFVVEGIVIGVAGAILAIVIALLSYNYALGLIPELIKASVTIITLSEIMPTISISFITAGITLGTVGSAVAVRKHLKV